MKRLLCGLSIIVLVLVMISPAAQAATFEDTYALVAAANEAIEARIVKAQGDADKLLALRDVLMEQVKTSEQRKGIDMLTNTGLDTIIASLVRDTNRISAKTIEAAANNGVKVICTWVEVSIGGRTVLVDPLIVCNE